MRAVKYLQNIAQKAGLGIKAGVGYGGAQCKMLLEESVQESTAPCRWDPFSAQTPKSALLEI